MVLENDDARKRQGVQPTYKKVKGFHPLKMNRDHYMVDAVFRGGSKHSNHGDTVEKMLVHIVDKIHREYRDDVPIVVRMDAAFFKEEIFKSCEQLLSEVEVILTIFQYNQPPIVGQNIAGDLVGIQWQFIFRNWHLLHQVYGHRVLTF